MEIQSFYNNLNLHISNARTKKALKVIKKMGQNHIRNLPSTTDSKIIRKAKIEQKKLELNIKRKEKTVK